MLVAAQPAHLASADPDHTPAKIVIECSIDSALHICKCHVRQQSRGMGGIVSPSTPLHKTTHDVGEGCSKVPARSPTHLHAGDLVCAAGSAPTCMLPPAGVRRLEIF